MKKGQGMKKRLLVTLLICVASDLCGIYINCNITTGGGDPGKEPIICALDGDIEINCENAQLERTTICGKKVDIKADNLQNRASKIKASESVIIDAKNQTNETVINKWTSDWRLGRNWAHAEGIKSIDDCIIEAPLVVQKGENIKNIGTLINADTYLDQGKNTLNAPAHVRLENIAHAEKRNLFNRATSEIRQIDDVSVSTRYNVGRFLSAPLENEKAAITNCYTQINANASIEINKEVRKDLPFTERHEKTVKNKTSGISIGGISLPNPVAPLQSMHQAQRNGNMIGFFTSGISSAAKGIQAYNDIRSLSQAADIPSILTVMSHFINGPSIRIGTTSMNMSQTEIISRGNVFVAPKMVFHNKEECTFAGQYIADDIDIRTKTFITFALPHEMTSEFSVHQSGVALDLLSFAAALINPALEMGTGVLLRSSSVSINSQNTRSHVIENISTRIIANKKLNIESENGKITQAQIKAGLVHAIFTKDLVIESIANGFSGSARGVGISTSLGFISSFGDFTKALRGAVSLDSEAADMLSATTVTHIDSGGFERIIDDYAAFVGTEKFYLKVGGTLTSKSAFFGYLTHDRAHEHIEAGKIHEEKVPEERKHWDNSFTMSFGDLTTVIAAFKSEVKQQAIEDGFSEEKAAIIAEQETKEVEEELVEFQKDAEKVKKLAVKAKGKLSAERKGGNDSMNDLLLDMLLNPTEEEPSILERQVSDCFNQVLYEKLHVSPQEQVFAFVPRTTAEMALKEATLLRYKLEDFVARHPNAAEFCCNLFAGAVYALQGVEYAESGGPVVIAAKIALQEGAAWAIEKTVDEYSDQVARLITSAEALQHEFANTIKVSAYAGFCIVGTCTGFRIVSAKASKKLIKSLKKSALEAAIRKSSLKMKKLYQFDHRYEGFKESLGKKLGLYKEKILSSSEIGLDWKGPGKGEKGYGMKFENYLATLPEFAKIRLPNGYKTFDFWDKENGRAISVKTMNTNTLAKKLKPSKIYSKLKKYIDDTLAFEDFDRGRVDSLVAPNIKTREIQLGIPADTGAAQLAQIQRAINYAKKNNVDFIVTRIK